MKALEIIEEIKSLPSAQKDRAIEFVHSITGTDTIEAIEEPLKDLPRFDSVDQLFEELKS